LAQTGSRVVAKQPAANIQLTHDLVHCLRDREWLNDEVIDFYFELLKERMKRNANDDSKRAGSKVKAHYFNSKFAELLRNGYYDYKKVKRWSKGAKVKIIELDKVFIPVHVGGDHWCLAVINFVKKRFEYYDSLGGSPGRIFTCLRKYVQDEAASYSGQANYDLSEWKDYVPKDIPNQDNGSDCGVFTCKYADYMGEGLELHFTHEDMSYFRRRMLLELMANRLE
jgi:sentrin-specific protease 1